MYNIALVAVVGSFGVAVTMIFVVIVCISYCRKYKWCPEPQDWRQVSRILHHHHRRRRRRVGSWEPSPILHRSPNEHQRDVEYQMEQEEEENREGTREWDLSETPPPAYRHVEEYQNVDLEHAEVVRLKQTTYRLSSYLEPETESLPPDYVSNRGEDEMSERVSISVATQQTPEGELPPTYNNAQLELMARRTATELNTVTEMSIPIDEEESSTAEAFDLQLETPV